MHIYFTLVCPMESYYRYSYAYAMEPEQPSNTKTDCLSCRIVRVATMAFLSAYGFANHYSLPKGHTGRVPLLMASVCAAGLAGYSVLK